VPARGHARPLRRAARRLGSSASDARCCAGRGSASRRHAGNAGARLDLFRVLRPVLLRELEDPVVSVEGGVAVPVAVLVLWLIGTLGWWAFAFAPLPAEPAGWLSAARHACFGSADDGLPAAHGWMVLILGPASFLAGIVALWGRQLLSSLVHVGRTRSGQ